MRVLGTDDWLMVVGMVRTFSHPYLKAVELMAVDADGRISLRDPVRPAVWNWVTHKR